MTIELKDSAFIVIDLQEKLLPSIDNNQTIIYNCNWLTRLANRMNVPVLLVEQYPKGLGITHHSIRELVVQSAIIDKVHFSAARNINFIDKLAVLNKTHLIICGIEAHVCVLQTAMDLNKLDYKIYVVADATGSRNPEDKKLALSRMQQHGIQIVTKEMVLFEWLEISNTELFKKISTEFLK
jgi:nicotinamidase-related amidase